MTQADLDAVGVLAGQLVRLHHAYDPRRFMTIESPERGYARFFSTQLALDEVILLVATHASFGVVGYAYARMEPKSYDELLDACIKLHDIFVDERARRLRVGEALLREILRRAAEKGAPRVVLLTATQNQAAHRLFEKLGFRRTMIEMTRELDTDSR